MTERFARPDADVRARVDHLPVTDRARVRLRRHP
jgi:hypothetical protein